MYNLGGRKGPYMDNGVMGPQPSADRRYRTTGFQGYQMGNGYDDGGWADSDMGMGDYQARMARMRAANGGQMPPKGRGNGDGGMWSGPYREPNGWNGGMRKPQGFRGFNQQQFRKPGMMSGGDYSMGRQPPVRGVGGNQPQSWGTPQGSLSPEQHNALRESLTSRQGSYYKGPSWDSLTTDMDPGERNRWANHYGPGGNGWGDTLDWYGKAPGQGRSFNIPGAEWESTNPGGSNWGVNGFKP